MKIIDTTLSKEEKAALSSLVGKNFQKYRCDEFLFRPSVYQAVELFVGGCAFEIESKERTVDYFGSPEDVSCLSFRAIVSIPENSRIEGQKQVDTPVNDFIQDIVIIEDVETMSNGGSDLYEFRCTRAIIFELPNRKIVFEKDVWFSEDVNIYKGPHADEKVMPPDEDMAESDEYDFRVDRTRTSLASTLMFGA